MTMKMAAVRFGACDRFGPNYSVSSVDVGAGNQQVFRFGMAEPKARLRSNSITLARFFQTAVAPAKRFDLTEAK
jgi:hypothetical protein